MRHRAALLVIQVMAGSTPTLIRLQSEQRENQHTDRYVKKVLIITPIVQDELLDLIVIYFTKIFYITFYRFTNETQKYGAQNVGLFNVP